MVSLSQGQRSQKVGLEAKAAAAAHGATQRTAPQPRRKQPQMPAMLGWRSHGVEGREDGRKQPSGPGKDKGGTSRNSRECGKHNASKGTSGGRGGGGGWEGAASV